MPVSPITRGTQGSSLVGKRKRKSKPTTSRRAQKQKLRDRYAHAREDAQLAGLIPTTPEVALRPEYVDPRLQGCQQLPALVLRALHESWATPDEAKPAIVGALLEPFFANDIMLDKDGNQVRVPPDRGMLLKLAQVLRDLDQTQFERDHPEQAAKAKGGGATSISVQTNVTAAALIRGMIESGQLSESGPIESDGAMPTSVESSTPGGSGHNGQVAQPTTLESNNGEAG